MRERSDRSKMESPDYHDATSSSVSHGRPSLGFPLGTALLLVVIFSLSGIFSCCYHWDKLRRSLSLRAAADLEAHGEFGPTKHITPQMKLQKQEKQSMPVIMAGDNVPKFIAMPCPCQPQRHLNLVPPDDDVAKPPPPRRTSVLIN